MSKINFSDILRALPELDNNQLTTLIHYGSGLLAQRESKPKTRAHKKKHSSKEKGLAQTKSEFDSNPLYREFKVKDKALRAYLKRFKTTYKEVESNDNPPVEYHNFIEAKVNWFRSKEEYLSSKNESVSNKTESKST